MSRSTLYDAHTHLLPSGACGPLEKQVVLFVNATGVDDWNSITLTAQSHEGVRIVPFLGIHPWNLTDVTKEKRWRDRLVEHISGERNPRPFGIGEIGLDRVRRSSPFVRQMELFKEQLVLATEYNLPVSIHCVKAWPELLRVLEQNGGATPKILHSFTGPEDLIPALSALNCFFSLRLDSTTFVGRRGVHLLSSIPRERLLLETDSPSNVAVTWEEYRLKLEGVYQLAAITYECSLENVGELISANCSHIILGEAR